MKKSIIYHQLGSLPSWAVKRNAPTKAIIQSIYDTSQNTTNIIQWLIMQWLLDSVDVQRAYGNISLSTIVAIDVCKYMNSA